MDFKASYSTHNSNATRIYAKYVEPNASTDPSFCPAQAPSPRLQMPYVLLAWWKSSTGYEADSEPPPKTSGHWPPLAGGMRSGCLVRWEATSNRQDNFARATAISPGTTVIRLTLQPLPCPAMVRMGRESFNPTNKQRNKPCIRRPRSQDPK